MTCARCGHDEDDHKHTPGVDDWAWDTETLEEFPMTPCQVEGCDCEHFQPEDSEV